MARWFRVVNVSSHCGLPIVLASIALCIIASAAQAYSLYFLPEGAAIPLMIGAGAAGVVGVVAALTGFQILTILYLIGGTLIQIPVFVVIGFTSYTLSEYNDQCNCQQNNIYPYPYPYNSNSCSLSDYIGWLCKMDQGLLWSAISIAFVSCLFIGTTMQSFRKLRLYQQGKRGTIVQDRRGHVVNQEPCTVQPQPQTVYTVPASTVITSPPDQPIYVQNQGIYPIIPPPAYTFAAVQPPAVETTPAMAFGTVQPVNYNPPTNPDF